MLLGFVVLAGPAGAADEAFIKDCLARPIIGDHLALDQFQSYGERRAPRMPEPQTVSDWEAQANRWRQGVLDNVVYRGQAAAWRDAETKVEWQDTIAGGPGYHIRKLRYEALPGLWIPALLYEPDQLSGKVAVMLAVNGHDAKGKAAPYKQMRCINMAKRGMLVLNLEWLGMGQLRHDGLMHYRMNQLDLCGTSGLAPFYLAMKRGLDVLLSHENADPERVGVSGLSGGGWQTIIISSLDTRVTLCNPVAGYSSFRTRIRFSTDLGDSEQTPVDLAAYVDYDHLTAMLAPRPALLTYNAEDDCCFKADHALPPLLEAGRPIYRLYGKENYLHAHVNTSPGNHNFEQDNREALYRVLGQHFFDDKSPDGAGPFDPREIPSEDEVKSAEELSVELPEENADFNKLAIAVAKVLPRDTLPSTKDSAIEWQTAARRRLQDVLRAPLYDAVGEKVATEKNGDLQVTFWRLRIGDAWTVPAVEFASKDAKAKSLLVSDGGRAGAAAEVERLLAAGHRVLAVDPFFIGESQIAQRNFLYPMLLAALGDRPLGLQAAQLVAVARWLGENHCEGEVRMVANGERSCLMALAATAMDDVCASELELSGSLSSLKETIEANRSFDQAPELFSFGLLEQFDIHLLASLVAPRKVFFRQPGERARRELAGLADWYKLWDIDFQPLDAE